MQQQGIHVAIVHASGKMLLLMLGILLGRTLGAEGYGVYAYALALMSLLSVVSTAGVPQILLRDVAANASQGNWSYIRQDLRRGFLLVLSFSILIAIMGFCLLVWRQHDWAEATLWTTAGMLVLLPFAAFVTTAGRVLRGLQNLVAGQIVENIMRPAFVLLLLAIGVWGFDVYLQPQYAMAAQITAALLATIWALLLIRRVLPSAPVPAGIYQDAGFALKGMLPFTLISLAAVINAQADIIMLGWLRSAEEVGIYRVAMQGSVLVAFSLQVLNAIIAPQIAGLFASGSLQAIQALVTRSARIVTLTALPIAGLFIFYGETIVIAIFGETFSGSYLPLAIISVGHLVNAMFGSVGVLLNMTGHEQDTAKTLWLTTGINVILNIALIPLFGVMGAALASTCSLIIWNLLLYLLVRRRLGINSTVFTLQGK